MSDERMSEADSPLNESVSSDAATPVLANDAVSSDNEDSDDLFRSKDASVDIAAVAEPGGPASSSSVSVASEHDEEEQALQGLSMCDREILTLLAVDKRLASVLDLAASAIESLKPENSANEEQSVGLLYFEQTAGEYYKALDDIQSALRNSIHLIKRSRISPSLLQNSLAQPSYTSVLRDAPIAPGVLPAVGDDIPALSKGGLRLETQVWNDVASLVAKLSPASVET